MCYIFQYLKIWNIIKIFNHFPFPFMQPVNDNLGFLPQTDKERALSKSVEAESLFVFQGGQAQEHTMQIRGEYLIQISPDGQYVESGFRLCSDIKFQMFPFDDQNQSFLGRLDFQFPGGTTANLLLRKHLEFEHFIRIMEKKGVSQTGFHIHFKPYSKIKQNVFRCKHIKYQKLCSVKAWSKEEVFKTAVDRYSFSKYIQRFSSLKNKHFPRFQGVYQSRNSIFMIIEYLRSSLVDQIEMHRHPDLGTVSQIAYQLFKGLEYLHKMDITHKNIKPGNVMFRYGIENARHLEAVMVGAQLNDEELSFKRYGEPGFIAPEILTIQEGSESPEKRYTKACDVFSLGCIFHYLLTQKHLFPGNNLNQRIQLNAACKVNYKDEIYRNLRDSAKNLLFAMLEFDPEKRITVEKALKHEFFQGIAQRKGNAEKNESLKTVASEE